MPCNTFEADILGRLQGRGLHVVPQWGVGGYRLDFAVRHPRKAGRFLLAVEADGASYHSGVVARERDRLRQRPRLQAGQPIAAYTDPQLRQMVRWILSDDLPRSRDDVRQLVKRELGFVRDGKNIVARISAAIDAVMGPIQTD